MDSNDNTGKLDDDDANFSGWKQPDKTKTSKADSSQKPSPTRRENPITQAGSVDTTASAGEEKEILNDIDPIKDFPPPAKPSTEDDNSTPETLDAARYSLHNLQSKENEVIRDIKALARAGKIEAARSKAKELVIIRRRIAKMKMETERMAVEAAGKTSRKVLEGRLSNPIGSLERKIVTAQLNGEEEYMDEKLELAVHSGRFDAARRFEDFAAKTRKAKNQWLLSESELMVEELRGDLEQMMLRSNRRTNNESEKDDFDKSVSCLEGTDWSAFKRSCENALSAFNVKQIERDLNAHIEQLEPVAQTEVLQPLRDILPDVQEAQGQVAERAKELVSSSHDESTRDVIVTMNKMIDRIL